MSGWTQIPSGVVNTRSSVGRSTPSPLVGAGLAPLLEHLRPFPRRCRWSGVRCRSSRPRAAPRRRSTRAPAEPTAAGSSRSRSPQRRPRISPRRIPVWAERWNAGNNRCDSMRRGTRRSWSTSHALMSALAASPSDGESAIAATLRTTRPLRCASTSALFSIRWMLRTVFGARALPVCRSLASALEQRRRRTRRGPRRSACRADDDRAPAARAGRCCAGRSRRCSPKLATPGSGSHRSVRY